MNARKALWILRGAGAAIIVVVIALVMVICIGIERSAQLATPRLDGRQNLLRDALLLPARGFPAIPEVERRELGTLIPIARPIRAGDVPAWLDSTAPGVDVRGVPDLRQAIEAMSAVDQARRGASEDGSPLSDQQVATARAWLARAEQTAPAAASWVVYYNRGVLYRWQDNRQKAASDFDKALRHAPGGTLPTSEINLKVRIHILYALGESLIREGAETEGTIVPVQAIERLREAAVLSALLAKSGNLLVPNAAEFFTLLPATGLSTSVIRNDLIAAYLEAGAYTACGTPFTLDVCEQKKMSGRCKYRDETFCATRNKVSNELRELYDEQLARLAKGETPEAIFWALQNVAEIETENSLEEHPAISYNIAHLLLRLQQPKLAHRYLSRAAGGDDQGHVTEAMSRLLFVTSILSGEKLSADIPEPSTRGLTRFRAAYQQIYPGNDNEPAPFEPIQLDDDRKVEALDAWLFIRRYRHLLEQANFDGLIEEYNRVMTHDVRKELLRDWKHEVAVQLLRRAAAAREKAQPESAAVIDAYVARTDLFTDAELKEGGWRRPFSWWSWRGAIYYAAAGFVAALIAVWLWLCSIYTRTFVSAYPARREPPRQAPSPTPA